MRRTILFVPTMALALLLASGVALALTNIDCSTATDRLTLICSGTKKADSINGTAGYENIQALGGNDVVVGYSGGDRIEGGSGSDTLSAGDTSLGRDNLGTVTLYGGQGADTIRGQSAQNIVLGEGGNDQLFANDPLVLATLGGSDYIFGGGGSDTIHADDNYVDTIYCGDGSRDKVTYDEGVDLFTTAASDVYSPTPSADCEILNPVVPVLPN